MILVKLKKDQERIVTVTANLRGRAMGPVVAAVSRALASKGAHSGG